MAQIFVYDEWPDAVDTLGICGPLSATVADYDASKNGEMELTVQHPIDSDSRWAELIDGRLIKAYVPMRTTPIVPTSLSVPPSYVTSLERWTVKTDATRLERSVFTTVTALEEVDQAIRYAVLPAETSVYIIDTLSSETYDWSLVAWTDGRGWINTDAIEYAETLTPADSRAAIEGAIPSPQTRPQLFRIYGVTASDSGITVKARHVSYDLMGASTYLNFAAGTYAFSSAIDVFSSYWADLPKHVRLARYYNINATAEIGGWNRNGIIDAFLASSNSLTANWNCTLLRDNWEYTFLVDASYDPKYIIEYGRNLTGVTIETDSTDVIDTIIPIGQTHKGKPLYVADATYTVDEQTVVVSYNMVHSPNYTYSIPHISTVDFGSAIKASSGTSGALSAAYERLIRAALKKFADEKCDLPTVSLKINFIQLGRTEEYAQYRGLDALFLGDLVSVKHSRLGVDTTAEINKIKWDCLNEQYKSIEVGTPLRTYVRQRLAPWQIPGLASLQSYVDTISSLI